MTDPGGDRPPPAMIGKVIIDIDEVVKAPYDPAAACVAAQP